MVNFKYLGKGGGGWSLLKEWTNYSLSRDQIKVADAHRLVLRVPYTFFVTCDWGLYFSVILDSWYKSILRPCELGF